MDARSMTRVAADRLKPGDGRRAVILQVLEQAAGPLTGAALAELVGVSRQVVVQDIALLRSQGHPIAAAKAGYFLERAGQAVRLMKTRHGVERMTEEMNLIVDLGGEILDVSVNHRSYGRLSAALDIKSRRDAGLFMENLRNGVSFPLCSVTSGYHFHRVAAESEEVLDQIERALEEAGLLAEVLPYEVGAI